LFLVRAAERLVARASGLAAEVAAATLFLCLALVSYSIAMRYFVGQPQSWIDEVCGWLVAAGVMLALPEAQRRGEHIAVDVVTERLKGGWRRLAGVFAVATVLVSGAIMLNAGLDMIAFSRMVGLVNNTGIPDWIIQLSVPVGAGLLVLVAAAELLVRLSGLEPEGPTDDDPVKRSLE